MEDFEATGVMIDRPDAIDRDDAFAVRRIDDGWEAYVHVAAAATQVAADDDLDRKARDRIRTRYLPDRVVPMLSSHIEQQAALVEGATRATLRFGLRFGQDGELRTVQLAPAELRQAYQLSYSEAAAALGDTKHRWHRMLSDAHALAGRLLAKRRVQGALAVYAINHGWATDEEGNVVRLGVNERNAGYVIVQELMIAANAAAARWSAERELPILYRNHRVSAVAPPRDQLLDDLRVAANGDPGGQPDPATPESSSLSDGNPAEVPPQNGSDPGGAGLEAVRQRLALIQRPAVYAPTIAGHYGLNLPAYTHATSPLRRYPDLVNQRILLAVSAGEPSPYSAHELEQLGEEIRSKLVEFREQRAAEYRAAAKAETMRRVADTGLRQSSADDLHKVVEAAVSAGEPTKELSTELIRRTEAGDLPLRDACSVLLFTEGNGWGSVRQTVLDWLEGEPAHAISLLTMYASIADRGQVRWKVENVGTSDGPAVFAASAGLGDEMSVRRLAGSKREAKQQAALAFVAQLAGHRDPSRDLAAPGAGRVMPPPSKLPEIPVEQNPTMTVYQLIQLGILVDVEWRFESAGSPHDARHTCYVNALDGRNDDELEANGSANTKASAKATAAKALLAQLRR